MEAQRLCIHMKLLFLIHLQEGHASDRFVYVRTSACCNASLLAPAERPSWIHTENVEGQQ